MKQKYKITDVSEPENALEEQRVKDCKTFNKTILKLVVSCYSSIIGGTLMFHAMNMDNSYSLIATAFSTALIMLSGQFQHKAVTKLQKLYKKNGNEKVLYKEKNLGERTR